MKTTIENDRDRECVKCSSVANCRWVRLPLLFFLVSSLSSYINPIFWRERERDLNATGEIAVSVAAVSCEWVSVSYALCPLIGSWVSSLFIKGTYLLSFSINKTLFFSFIHSYHQPFNVIHFFLSCDSSELFSTHFLIHSFCYV